MKNITLIDLTHTLHPKIPTWDSDCGFKHNLRDDYDPTATYKFRTHSIDMQEGIGTHMDAPAHCIPGGKFIQDLDLNSLIAPCCVIDVSNNADEHYCVSSNDIERFEQQHGQIKAGSFVIVRTGWDQFWNEPEKYRNNFIYPCITEEAALLLLEKNIVGLGIDTLSPDRPEHGFPVHNAILGAGKYIVENIANSGSLPPNNSYSLALPIKIAQGTEAPVRLVGLIFHDKGNF